MSAYSELYLNDAAENLGEYLDFMVNRYGLDIDEAMKWFAYSNVGREFGRGNSKFVTGMSGTEIAYLIIYRITGEYTDTEPEYSLGRSPEYWAGWALAQYQWVKAYSFRSILSRGLSASRVRDSYILHEADITKFYEFADGIIEMNTQDKGSQLKRLRRYSQMTQKELSEKSGVALRMIQLYEQGRNDIKKAQAETLFSLAESLRCEPEDLI